MPHILTLDTCMAAATTHDNHTFHIPKFILDKAGIEDGNRLRIKNVPEGILFKKIGGGNNGTVTDTV